MTSLPHDDHQHLRNRIRKLADEKAYLQLVIHLIESLDAALGMKDMMPNLLKSIMESVGGTNIKLYYWIDKELHYIDFTGNDTILATIDDNYVLDVIEKRRFTQQTVNAKNAMLQYEKVCQAWHWIFPLLVGQELIGVIKIENLAIDSLPLRDYLSIVFTHAALLLSNEIRNYKRQRAEQELRNSEQKLLTVLDNVDAYIYLKDRKGRYLFANKVVRQLFNADATEIIGFTDEKFFDADTAANIRKNDQQVLKNGEILRAEEINTVPVKGLTFCYQSTKLPLRHEDGSIYGLCGISVDITERKKMEDVLRYERDRIQTYLNTVETVIIALDTKGYITLVNRKACSVLGYKEFELIGKSWFETCLPKPDNMEIIYPVFLKIMANDIVEAEYFENAIITHTGELRQIAWHNSLLHDEHGRTIGLLSSGEDITERKQTEAELQQYREHLEKLVENRTIELLLAKEAAEAANIAKSTFIATMSHELRTPLNAILGFSELMGHDPNLSETQKNTLDIINRSGAHLLNMINDVLDISKIEAGKLELSEQPCDLIQLLQDIASMVSIRAIANQLHFHLDIESNFQRYALIDCGKLRQVLINLLGNAVKFTKHGYVTLRATSQQLNHDQLLLNISVIDSGIGIAKEQMQQLFKPFIQLARENVDVEGTGLGLTISKALIELMGGQISVSSTLGVGSTFNITLTATRLQSEQIPFEVRQLPVKSIAPEQPEWRLLIVDDNADNRSLLIALFTKVGFQVCEAENGQRAIEQFKQWQPHLIWMDMRMPVMDGHEATQRIRQLPNGDKVKIVALTASAFKEQHETIINSGCDAVVHKPFQSIEIFNVLTKLLGVKFIYQEEMVNVLPCENISPTELKHQLPTELKRRLHEAALTLDIEEIDIIINEIQQLQPNIAACLDNLAKHYQFAHIVNLTQ